jgi:hypothetical protein
LNHARSFQIISDVRSRNLYVLQGNFAGVSWPATPTLVLDTYGGVERRVAIEADSQLASAVLRHKEAFDTGSIAEVELRGYLQSLQQLVAATSGPSWPARPLLLETITQLWRFCGIPSSAAKVCTPC